MSPPRGTGAGSDRLGRLERQVLEFIDARGLIRKGDRVLVACSGGPDSLCLLHLLARLSPRIGCTLALAHVDHGLRPGSDEEADRVSGWADRLGVARYLRRIEVPNQSEAAARRARYGALEQMADEAGADRVALGHTADDQAETIVMRLVRGAGLRGIAGMPVRRGRYVRPLMGVRKSDAVLYLQKRGIVALEDPSNESLRYFRNRVRRRIMPLLQVENPKVVLSLCRLSENARRELDRVDDLDRGNGPQPKGRRRLVRAPGPAGQVAVGIEAGLIRPRSDPSSVGWRTLRAAYLEVLERPGLKGGQLESKHLAGAEALATRGRGPGRLDLPGGVSMFGPSGGRFWVMPEKWLCPGGEWDRELTGPAILGPEELGVGWRITVKMDEGTKTFPPSFIRNWRPGDRVDTRDGHTSKLQDLFVNAKVPRPLRERLPLLVSREGQVLWVPGVHPGGGLRFRGAGLQALLEPVDGTLEGAWATMAGWTSPSKPSSPRG